MIKAFLFILVAITALLHNSHVFAEVAAKSYVDSMVENLGQSVQSDWNQADELELDYIKNKPIIPDISGKADIEDMSIVAFSGNYNDLIDKPTNTTYDAPYQIVTNRIEDAATGNSFEIEIDGWVFRATKQSSTNNWNLRVVNNTGAPATIGTRAHHLYSGTQSTGKETTLAVGAEMNPDTESGDIGYSKEDIFILNMFDTTNTRYYRITMAVYVKKAVMIGEKLI